MPGKKILVVEDDPIVRSDAAMLLEDAGLSVVQLDNADDALAFIYDQPGDIAAVFSDIHMPGHLSGLHLAETVARHWPTIPIILSSGRVRPFADLPASVQFMPKPWMPQTVLAAMKNASLRSLDAGRHRPDERLFGVSRHTPKLDSLQGARDAGSSG